MLLLSGCRDIWSMCALLLVEIYHKDAVADAAAENRYINLQEEYIKDEQRYGFAFIEPEQVLEQAC